MRIQKSNHEAQFRSRQILLHRERGLTFVELLVAISIAAAVLTVAVLAYQSIGQSKNRLAAYNAVQLPAGVMDNFYGTDSLYVQTYFAPNYYRAVEAEILRDKFYEDLDYSNAVFCLARTGRSTIRPISIPVTTTFDLRTLDTPEAFREFLEDEIPTSSTVFTAYRGKADATNLSVFILMPSDSATELTVRAVYELDFVPTTNPSGTYASVRRYQGATCTDFYDIFYPTPNLPAQLNRAFSPVVVNFEREARLNVTEGANTDRFKVAAHRPFYVSWWPDPASLTLESSGPPNLDTANARDAYASMVDRTSFFFTFPMFPSL